MATAAWKKIQDEVWDKTQGHCWYCGKMTARLSGRDRNEYREAKREFDFSGEFCVDHVIPVSSGGTDELDNLVSACASCNSAKRDRDVEQFRRDRAWLDSYGFSIPQKLYDELLSIGINLPLPELAYAFWNEIEGGHK